MFKLLKLWLEKKAYHHDWKLKVETKVYDKHMSIDVPYKITRLYFCKCGEMKQIEL